MAKTTKTDIIRSFEKLLAKKKYDKITIKDLTENCGLNRKTFYYYFSDIDELLTKTLDFEIDNFISSVDTARPLDEIIEKFVNAVKEYKKIIYHVYNSPRSEHIVEYAKESIITLFENTLAAELAKYDISADQKVYIPRVYAFTTIGFLTQWVDGGMEDDFMDYVKQLRIVLNGSLKLFASNSEKANKKEAAGK